MTYDCPHGCKSSDPDYCSECGASLTKGLNLPVETRWADVPAGDDALNQQPGAEICPDCGTPRLPGGKFCEVCRYDFDSKASNTPTASAPPPAPSPTLKPATPVVTKKFIPGDRLNVVIQVDPTLMTEEIEVQCPTGTPDKVFPLDLEENLVGRRSESKQVYPEIEVNDPGVSRRHLKLIRQDDGGFVALELGSANGTHLNGEMLEPGLMTPVKPGDELTIGHWTRLKITHR